MHAPTISSRTVLSALGYAALGVVGTAVAGVGIVYVLQPLQPVVYDALYLVLGPWTATEAASIFHLGVAGVLAVAVPTLAAELLDGDRARTVAAAFLALAVGLVVVLVAAALLGVLGFATLVLAYAALVAAVFSVLATGASTGSVAAFGGGVPVLAVLLLLLAVGLGWGGGYDVVAEPVPAADVAGPVADFDDAPRLRDDLFSETPCDPADAGVCRISLRGYAHEVEAARFLADHGVRCPFVNAPRTPVYDRDASFVAEHDGDYYRVTCEAYGD